MDWICWDEFYANNKIFLKLMIFWNNMSLLWNNTVSEFIYILNDLSENLTGYILHHFSRKFRNLRDGPNFNPCILLCQIWYIFYLRTIFAFLTKNKWNTILLFFSHDPTAEYLRESKICKTHGFPLHFPPLSIQFYSFPPLYSFLVSFS